MAEEGRGNWQR